MKLSGPCGCSCSSFGCSCSEASCCCCGGGGDGDSCVICASRLQVEEEKGVDGSEESGASSESKVKQEFIVPAALRLQCKYSSLQVGNV